MRRLVLWSFLAAALLAGCRQPARALQGDPAAQREDLEAFRRDFLAIDRSYSVPARTKADARLRSLEASAGVLSNTQFVLALSQVVALADNGHTTMMYRGDAPDLGRVGVRLAPFGEEFFAVRAVAAHADLLGGRLVAIDGRPIAQLRDSARTLTGGIAAWRDRMAPAFLESPGQLHALGLGRSSTSATYRFELRDGRTVDAVLPRVDPIGSDQYGPVGAIDPDTPAGWRSLLAPGHEPWALSDFDEQFRRRDAPELDAIVIQLHRNFDASNQSIAAFLAASDSMRRALGRKNVVLDMRFNGGGDLQTTREFMSDLPGRIGEGRVFVLTSPWTFSAAISSTGYLKQAGGDRVVLVGEAPGDRLQFWAEGRPVVLPRSGAYVQYATQRHDYLTGCQPFTDCHRYMVTYPIAVQSLAPDVAAPWTLESYAAGRDPGMEAVERLVRGRK